MFLVYRYVEIRKLETTNNMKPKSNQKKIVKAWAVMPEHRENFSLVWDKSLTIFANAIFRSKEDAMIYKRYTNKKVDPKQYPICITKVEISFSLPIKAKKK